ncbi:DUF1648 domain-containing protein [Mesobacillus maritimus]|uniref:DUF1648 domain-containing protein n=1 Tax=Mesobacillus maritimus TaxID=1643336 RepID=A0ABS7K993_9BACI|nr:DUF1648 domain-containing protein [Mesobacillus maritimus]MBY0098826.1 DUF1648 domain-containing protein [Mesobacillus maritimus]
MEMTILFIISFFLAIMETAIPYLIKRTVVFGVTIPDENTRDRRLLGFKKQYSIIVSCFSLVVLVGFWVWGMQANPVDGQLFLVGIALPFAIMFVSLACYVYFHARTSQLKRAEKWGEDSRQVKISDLSVRSQDEMLPWYMYLFPMLVTLGVIIYTVLQYPSLPDQIPTHWGPNGQPDAFTPKSPASAISTLLILLVMQAMFLMINETTKRSGIKLSATRTTASRIRQLTLRKYTSWFMFITSILITMLFSFLQLSTIHEGMFGEGVMLIVPFVFLLVVLGGTVVFAVKVGRAGEDIGSESVAGMADFDEDQYWKGGLFYFNKNDPSIFVEKRFGVGMTLNFANPKGYLLVLGPIVLILVVSFVI